MPGGRYADWPGYGWVRYAKARGSRWRRCSWCRVGRCAEGKQFCRACILMYGLSNLDAMAQAAAASRLARES